MAFLSLTNLVQRCIVRVRQVPGVTTQAYSEQHFALLLEECYEQARALRWWDHLTSWQQRTLDGATGRVTVPFVGAREGINDVQAICYGNVNTPLSMLTQHHNPSRYTGNTPRAVEALSLAEDVAGAYLFRVWPLTATGDVWVRVRQDPPNVFKDNSAVVPFDATALINGACMKYTMGDGTNPGAVMELDRAWNERVKQLLQQHDSKPLVLDTRTNMQSDWIEDWR